MSTPAARDDDRLGPSAKAALDAVITGRGSIPDLFRVAVNLLGALGAFIGPNGALAKGCLRAAIRENIALDAFVGLNRALANDRLGAKIREVCAFDALFGLNTNHLNIVAGADMDFPVVRAARLVAA